MTYTIQIFEIGRPPTINAVYGQHHKYVRAALVKQWREAAAWKWLKAIPKGTHFERFKVKATPLHKNKLSPQDVGACVPAVSWPFVLCVIVYPYALE